MIGWGQPITTLPSPKERSDGEIGLDHTRTRICRVHSGGVGRGDDMNNAMKDATYDYRLQVWTIGGVVQTCGHPQSMRLSGPCCNQYRYAGQRSAGGHEEQPTRRGKVAS